MEIRVAETAGFCFGVNRAVDIIYKMLSEGKKVCTLGPIIHNPQVIEDLQEKGVRIISDVSEVPEGYEVVIRAHGVTKQIIESLDNAQVKYTDATCPYVLKIHRIIKEQTNENDIILIAGDGEHPEVRGFSSHCKGEYFTFKNENELKVILDNNDNFENKQIFLLQQNISSDHILLSDFR